MHYFLLLKECFFKNDSHQLFKEISESSYKMKLYICEIFWQGIKTWCWKSECGQCSVCQFTLVFRCILSDLLWSDLTSLLFMRINMYIINTNRRCSSHEERNRLMCNTYQINKKAQIIKTVLLTVLWINTREGQSRLHLLRKLRSFWVQGAPLTSFYDSVVASAIFYRVVCWSSSISAAGRRRLD